MSIKNKVTLVGRLTRDLEVGTTAKNSLYGKSAIAVNENYKGADGQWVEKTLFVDIIVWGDKSVNYLKDRFKKGCLVAVEGKLEINAYTAKDGSKRTSTVIRVLESMVLDKRNNNQGSTNKNYAPTFEPANDFGTGNSGSFNDFSNAELDNFSPIGDDEDIPF